jgi:hypothetical protein
MTLNPDSKAGEKVRLRSKPESDFGGIVAFLSNNSAKKVSRYHVARGWQFWL